MNRRNQKRKKISSGEFVDIATYKNLNMDDKLPVLFNQLQANTHSVTSIEPKIDQCVSLHSKVDT